MIDHHMIRAPEREGKCIYCSRAFEKGKWESSFSEAVHYKSITCRCGRENTIRVSFIGTGHDSWAGLEEKLAQSRIKVLETTTRKLKEQ